MAGRRSFGRPSSAVTGHQRVARHLGQQVAGARPFKPAIIANRASHGCNRPAGSAAFQKKLQGRSGADVSANGSKGCARPARVPLIRPPRKPSAATTMMRARITARHNRSKKNRGGNGGGFLSRAGSHARPPVTPSLRHSLTLPPCRADRPAAPRRLCGEWRRTTDGSGRTARRQLSAASSSPSASASGSPSRILSARMPEFCRMAASMRSAISGLALRKAFAFSRPCPMRWLS
jgi:hypothetical protein